MRAADESDAHRVPLRGAAGGEGMIVADKRCQNGHVIDEVWDLCPYCPSDPRSASPSVAASSRSPASSSSPASSAVARPAMGRPERAAPFREEAPAGPMSWHAGPPQQTVMAPKGITMSGSTEPRWVVGWLVSVSGRMMGESFAIRGGRNIIGRSAKSDIVIPDEQVSSHHADIVYRSDERRFILMDHHSTNGTFVNESEVSPRIDLVDRDVVRLGRQKFMFVALCDRHFGWDQVEQKR